MFSIVLLVIQCAIFYGQNNFVTATLDYPYNEQVRENAYPFIVSINVKRETHYLEDNHFCGGSLISQKHVLTAAQCVDNQTKDNIEVIAGTQDLGSQYYQRFDVKCWVTYKSWSSHKINLGVHDLAVISLDTENTNIVPVVYLSPAKARKFRKLKDSVVTLPGWGISKTHRITPPLMQKIYLIVLSKAECRQKIKQLNPASVDVGGYEALLCTNPRSDSTLASCGFSGSPILDENNYLVGVHLGICQAESLSIFSNPVELQIEADIGYYNEFILAAMKIC